MENQRIRNIFYILGTIVLGLLSRQIEWIPAFTGDMLYAVMMFFIFRFIFVKESEMKIAFIALLATYCVEFSQLYKAKWIMSIRSTSIGKLVLGQGFLWEDILSYTVAIACILLCFNVVKRRF